MKGYHYGFMNKENHLSMQSLKIQGEVATGKFKIIIILLPVAQGTNNWNYLATHSKRCPCRLSPLLYCNGNPPAVSAKNQAHLCWWCPLQEWSFLPEIASSGPPTAAFYHQSYSLWELWAFKKKNQFLSGRVCPDFSSQEFTLIYALWVIRARWREIS